MPDYSLLSSIWMYRKLQFYIGLKTFRTIWGGVYMCVYIYTLIYIYKYTHQDDQGAGAPPTMRKG